MFSSAMMLNSLTLPSPSYQPIYQTAEPDIHSNFPQMMASYTSQLFASRSRFLTNRSPQFSMTLVVTFGRVRKHVTGLALKFSATAGRILQESTGGGLGMRFGIYAQLPTRS